MSATPESFESAFAKAVDLGNKLADKDKGRRSLGTSRTACWPARCSTGCIPDSPAVTPAARIADISTAEARVEELKRLVRELQPLTASTNTRLLIPTPGRA